MTGRPSTSGMGVQQPISSTIKFLPSQVGLSAGLQTAGSSIPRGSACCLNPTLFMVRENQPGRLNPPQASVGLGPSEEHSSQLRHVLKEPPSGRTEFSPIWSERGRQHCPPSWDARLTLSLVALTRWLSQVAFLLACSGPSAGGCQDLPRDGLHVARACPPIREKCCTAATAAACSATI